MSNTISLKAEQRRRSGTADVRRLRREGLIPAVIYGKGLDNVNLKIDARGFTRLMQEQERFRETSNERLREDVAVGIAQLDRGERIPAEAVIAELTVE